MNWFQRLSRKGRMEKELDAELRFRFETQVADKIQSGLAEAEARRATRLEFGGLEQIKEGCRESHGTLRLVSIVQDPRFGARILAKSPGFSVTAIVVLALGTGICTPAFSLYNIAVLQSFPVRDPATLVRIQRRSPENTNPGVPYASIVYYRDIWLPLLQHSYFVEGSKPLTDPKFEGLIGMWGRLAPGVSTSRAEHELLSLTNQLRKLYTAVVWDHEYIVITPGARFLMVEDIPGHGEVARATARVA